MTSSCQIACHQAQLSNLGLWGSMGRFMQWHTQWFMMFNNTEFELCIISDEAEFHLISMMDDLELVSMYLFSMMDNLEFVSMFLFSTMDDLEIL